MNAIHFTVNAVKATASKGAEVPRVSMEHLQDRQAALIDAARDLFTAKGFQQTSMNDIARAAGVSDGLAYRYFTSKRALLLAVLDRFYGRLIDDLERSVAERSDFAARLSALVERHLDVFVHDLEMCRLFISEVRNFSDYAGSDEHDLNRRYTSILLRILEDGRAEGRVLASIDDRIVRDMLFGGIEHLAWRHAANGHAIDTAQAARDVTALLLGGLTRKPAQ